MKSGSILDLQDLFLKSFASLSEEQQRQVRRDIYKLATGKTLKEAQ